MHLFLHIFIFDFLPGLPKPLTTYPPSIQKSIRVNSEKMHFIFLCILSPKMQYVKF